MKIEITEYVEERFDVDVPGVLSPDELEAAVEQARINYEGKRDIAVVRVDWEKLA